MSVEIKLYLVSCYICNNCTSIRIIKLGLSLTLKSWRRMLNCNNCSHTVSYIKTCKISVLILQDTKLSRILVNNRCKLGLKACNMRSTLLSVYVITETKNIFLKFINKLECDFNLNVFLLLLKVDDITYGLFAIVKIFDIRLKSVRLMESFLIFTALSLILKLNCKSRIKICCLMKPALYRICLESCLFKYFSIRKKCNSCTSIILSACTNLFKWCCCLSLFVPLLVHSTVNSYLNLKPYRKCINYRCTNAVKSA